MPKDIHIEKIIQQHLVAEGRNVSWLCEQLNWQRRKWYRFLNNGLIEVTDLHKISVLLNHNFFQYYYNQIENKCDKIATNV